MRINQNRKPRLYYRRDTYGIQVAMKNRRNNVPAVSVLLVEDYIQTGVIYRRKKMKSKVYVISHIIIGEEFKQIVGVYRTKEGAENEVKRLRQLDHIKITSKDYFRITEEFLREE